MNGNASGPQSSAFGVSWFREMGNLPDAHRTTLAMVPIDSAARDEVQAARDLRRRRPTRDDELIQLRAELERIQQVEARREADMQERAFAFATHERIESSAALSSMRSEATISIAQNREVALAYEREAHRALLEEQVGGVRLREIETAAQSQLAFQRAQMAEASNDIERALSTQNAMMAQEINVLRFERDRQLAEIQSSQRDADELRAQTRLTLERSSAESALLRRQMTQLESVMAQIAPSGGSHAGLPHLAETQGNRGSPADPAHARQHVGGMGDMPNRDASMPFSSALPLSPRRSEEHRGSTANAPCGGQRAEAAGSWEPMPEPRWKRKEAETVKVPAIPTATSFRAWKLALRDEISGASGAPDQAFSWIMKVEREGITVEELGDSEAFPSLDAKLAAALSRTLQGDLAQQVNLVKERHAGDGKFLKGRQILWYIHRHFKVSEADGALLDFDDLLHVQLHGDDLRSFMTRTGLSLSLSSLPKKP